MREIGSEFWDIPVCGNDQYFPGSTQWFLSGRSALQGIVKELHERHTVAMPSWCCDSMIKPFIDAGMDVRFYPVYWQGGLIQEIDTDCDVLFLMDYFGYSSSAPDLSGYKGIVIRDVTHSIFTDTYADAAYCFGSLRKWCGVWTGGYAWTRDGHALLKDDRDDLGYISLREKAMQLKESYIRGLGTADKGYLKIFREAEDVLEHVGCVPAADRDVRYASRLDVEGIRAKRRANAKILMAAFADWLVFPELKDGDCPMFVPVLVPDGRRDNLRRCLIQHEIYCPVHWPVSRYHRLDGKTEGIYGSELSLVCDQRYSADDMKRLADTADQFWKGV